MSLARSGHTERPQPEDPGIFAMAAEARANCSRTRVRQRRLEEVSMRFAFDDIDQYVGGHRHGQPDRDAAPRTLRGERQALGAQLEEPLAHERDTGPFEPSRNGLGSRVVAL